MSHRTTTVCSLARAAGVAFTIALNSALASAQPGVSTPKPKSGAAAGAAISKDSAFQAVQSRGGDARAMGVDQQTSAHRFDALPDGGRIELQRERNDSAGVRQIRKHLREIAASFAAGDFRVPGFVHARKVPGTDIMTARRGAIQYSARDLPRGGEVRITTRDPVALTAIHEFIAFQRADHRAAGVDSPPPSDAHAAHHHEPM